MMNSKVHMYRHPLTLHPSLLNAIIITVRTELYVCSNKTCDKTYRFPRYNDVSKVSDGVVSHSIFFTLHVTYKIMNQCTYIKYTHASICAYVRAPSQVIETRMGRCGEYSVLMMQMLESLDYDTKWVVDWADHVRTYQT
jgi:hypothetical protein